MVADRHHVLCPANPELLRHRSRESEVGLQWFLELVMIELTILDHGQRHSIHCSAVLFDMDGTLVDSTFCVEETWRLWALRHNLDPGALMTIVHGRVNEEVIQMVAPHLNTPVEHAFLVTTEENCRERLVAIEGAQELLRQLPRDRWAVVTSAWMTLAQMRLESAGLPCPEVLITADQVERSKPDPAGYLLAAARLGIQPEACLVVEDSPTGIEAATAAQMRVLGITTTFRREQLDSIWCIPDLRAITVERRAPR